MKYIKKHMITYIKYMFAFIIVFICGVAYMINMFSKYGHFEPDAINISQIGNSEFWELTGSELKYIDPHGIEWVAPIGTHTDGASVPRVAIIFTNGRFDKTFIKAAVVHDAYCQQENKEITVKQFQSRPWEDVHWMFYEAMLAGGTEKPTAMTMYLAILIYGPRWNDPDRNLQEVPDKILQIAYGSGKGWLDEAERSPEEISEWVEQREPTMIAVSKSEAAGLEALQSHDIQSANRSLLKATNIIEQALKTMPDDRMLLSIKSNIYINRAVKFQQLGMKTEALNEINKAEASFDEAAAISPHDLSSFILLNEISAVRSDIEKESIGESEFELLRRRDL